MGLFSKKKQPAPPPAPEPVRADVPANQQFYQENGLWKINPNYKPEATASESPKVTGGNTWSEDLDHFLARKDDAKKVKLTGKPEDFAFYEVGNRCKVEEDFDHEGKYNVLCGGIIIGRLPSAAVSYAEENDCPPDDLDVIIAEVEYDIEKDRDIITVYVSY